ncbi:general transcription factor 3C polypeptide 1-like isoform X2 [Carcharodon carcharias]|uniref:general transcription factor 3C polypeptide 1-like isoform X2 n=1 Tax=Carcharodon carcharias TaxID=13397 RepID=UPI001B7DBBEA|nr:general transcription factor 3C polypeptide 1-like isoform X2 [Carcharodon carcharias]
MAALDSLLDEVALEGLDGITFSTLWFRLDNRVPAFPLQLDPATRQFVWEALAACPQLSFFRLPQDRPALVFYDRYEEIDPETGIQETRRDPTPRDDIYPVCIISDNKDEIQGSCQHFHKRKDITAEIRTQQYIPCCTLDEAVKRWGEKLVIVASQMVRHRALIGWESDPELNLPDYSYCILERLGRARWQGELQRDLHSGAFKIDARKMHYHRRVLDRNNLITLQSHVIRQPNGNQQYSILLLLKRFHVDRRSKYDILMEKISNILVNRPNQLEVMLTLRDELGLCERTFKKLYQYMVAGGIAKVITVPLKDLNPEGGPCVTKKGTQIIVRCLKLIKPYGKKVDDEDDDEEDNKTVERMDVVYERDMLTQAYELIEKRGTKGISQTEIRLALNVGKLEGRMLCRLLERYKVITGFMEDEGRQRTTKYVAKTFVEQSELSKQFEKEKARSEQLATTSFLPLEHAKSETVRQQALSQAKNLAESKSIPQDLPEGLSKANHGRKEPVKLITTPAQNNRSSHSEHREKKCTTSQKIYKGKKLVKSALFRKFKLKKGRKSKLGKGRKLPGLVKATVGTDHSQNMAKRGEESSKESQQIDLQLNSSRQNKGCTSCTKLVHSQCEENVVIEEVKVEKAKEKGHGKKRKPSKDTHLKRPHETFRMLKRQNLILEAVRNLKLIESLFSLQKMIMEEEKQDGVVTRCCKKSIVRMVQKLSQEGLLRLFRTTVIQDGISKKVEFVAHPSVLPSDPLVKSAIEQVRFRISSSYTVHRMKVLQLHAQKEKEKQAKENASVIASSESEQNKNAETASKCSTSKTDEKMGVTPLKNYRPVIVPGLGRSLGFLPKMPRLRLVHMFLWYIVYGHPLRRTSEEAVMSAPLASAPTSATEEASGAEAPKEPAVASTSNGTTDIIAIDGNNPAANGMLVGTSTTIEIGEDCQWDGNIEHLHVKETVYVDEASWKRYSPPTPIHREFGYGWALISDILLCVPLSIFVQIVQVSHKVENLDEFLNDHYMKHTLVRDLPQPIRQQLLYKRRYIFSIFESLQRLCYMGLLQFGPIEKFQEKDQIFVYIKKNAMIVDTTSCDPHYNLARSSRPFDNRCYALNNLQDVESFWFDLMCVCLNTPLGVIRFPRLNRNVGQAAQEGAEDTAFNSVMEQDATAKNTQEHKCSLLEYTTGSRKLMDDGKLPGDGLGAAGLDSSFFGHLKRNWIWTSYIINNAKKSLSIPESSSVRLQSFLNKHSLPLGVAGNKFSMLGVLRSVHGSLADKEEIRIEKECNVGRNKRVAGGKGQKRKRPEKESGKKQRKKRRKEDLPQQEKTKRFRFQDDADRSALRRMTKLRVTWTAQEDSLLMLCRVASHVLNKKVKGPFVPWQTVRDVMHDYLEVALDKTSLAVGRRSRYILKNPQTMLNYRICLAEVHEDHALINEIMNKKNNYQDSKVCAEEFKEFVGRLRQKFTSAIGSGNIEIPDTLQELFARFKILVVGEEGNENQKQDNVKSIDDIHYLVLQNFIQSTLALSDTQMKSCQSFQTFHLYKQYKDEVLVKVFLEFQQRSLVNRRRVSKALGPKKSRALPFAPMSYQLSQAYYRNFMWRFPSNICSESYNFVQKLKSAGSADIPNTFSFQDKEIPVETEMVTYPLDGNGGYCVATISLFILGLLSFHVSVPEQIVVVDSTLVDNEVIKRLGKEGIDDYEDDDLEETGNKPKFEVKAPQASHTNYLLMRGYYAPGIVSTRNLNPNDNIVVNSCQVRLKVRSTPAHGCLSTHDGSATLFQTASGPDALPRAFTKVLRPSTDVYVGENIKKQLVEELKYSPEDLTAMQEITNEIEACSTFGMEAVELGKKYVQYEEVLNGRTRTLKQYLQDLIELDQMVEVGGSGVRLVAITHAYPWLLHPFRVRRSVKTGPTNLTDVGSKGRTESSAKNIEESTEDIEGYQDNTKPDPSTSGTEKEIEQHKLESTTVQNEAVQLSNIQALTGSRKRTIEEVEGEIIDQGLPIKIPHRGSEPSDLSCDSSVRSKPLVSTVDETKAGFPQHHIGYKLVKSPDLHSGPGKVDSERSQDEDQDKDGNCKVFSSSYDIKGPNIPSASSQPDEQSMGEDGKGQLRFPQDNAAGSEQRNETTPPADGQVLLQEKNSVAGPVEHSQQDESLQVSKNEDRPKLPEEGDDTVKENVNIENTVQTPSESEFEQISFVCHPWRIVDGSLNKPVCKGMVEAMLYHIMTKPGITKQKLLSYYSAVLQPVIILEILQALETIGCIRKRYLTKAKPVSLFSTPTSGSEVQDCKLSESFTVFYEPTIDCVLRLGKVFPHEPNWNKWIQ